MSARETKPMNVNAGNGSFAYWNREIPEIFAQIDSSPDGVSPTDQRVIERYSRHSESRSNWSAVWLFVGQFRSPISLILIAAALLSFFLNDRTDSVIILEIVVISAILGFWQEHAASNAVAKLLALISTKITVIRGGREMEIPAKAVIVGDVVVFSAGGTVPGDCRIVECHDLFVNEAALTGETFPVEKHEGIVPSETDLHGRTNCLFHGTHVVSGTGKGVVVATGDNTELGRIADRLRLRSPETDFERGVRRFGYLLMQVTFVLLVLIFAVDVYLRHPVLEAFLFALALAVGMTPQLLPAIVSVTLSFGAQRLAQRGVIVRRLPSIENFGSMDVLCSDKTGTLTEGVIHVDSAINSAGESDDRVLEFAYVNASFESGYANPLDEAVRNAGRDRFSIAAWEKLDEIPYDFIRKRLSVLAKSSSGTWLITKGAVHKVLECCDNVELRGATVPLGECEAAIEAEFEKRSQQGLRLLGVAIRELGSTRVVHHDAESSMTFVGFLALLDPPKKDAHKTLQDLHQLGIQLRMVTGDNRLVAKHVGEQIGWDEVRVLTGDEIRHMSDDALRRAAEDINVFAEVEPNQKERIIRSIQRAGHVVGYIGDGINDATAIHAADVGISVDSAVDVAKEAADIVLMRQSLDVLVESVELGRATFANTLKYVYLATSANFGNMFSMACSSIFLPFLPLLPKQVLLTNVLTDLPEMMIAQDRVDRDQVASPQRWNIERIRRFMVVFGALSSIFDFTAFGVLLWVGADAATFRTGWFIESVVSACSIVLVMRTHLPFWRSQPSRPLAIANAAVIATTIALPFLPFSELLGFVPLSVGTLFLMLLISAWYVISAEWLKRWFFAKSNHTTLANR